LNQTSPWFLIVYGLIMSRFLCMAMLGRNYFYLDQTCNQSPGMEGHGKTYCSPAKGTLPKFGGDFYAYASVWMHLQYIFFSRKNGKYYSCFSCINIITYGNSKLNLDLSCFKQVYLLLLNKTPLKSIADSLSRSFFLCFEKR
jgi:hypothetical protein